MRIAAALLAAAAGALAAPTDVAAQISCGTPNKSLQMRQGANYAQYVEVTAQTARSWTTCPITLKTEAWVEGLSGSLVTSTGVYLAESKFGRPVPYYGKWHATSKHWSIWSGFSWQYLGTLYAEAQIVPPPAPPPSGCQITPADCDEGTQWVPPCTCKLYSPILVDTAGDGYELTDSESGVAFDLNANDVPEYIAWTKADSDDAWLVLDRNGNGLVDDGTELFGNATPAYKDQAYPTSDNGFTALQMLEHPEYGPGFHDGIIDASDAVFSHLRLWFDRNHDGTSQPDELVSLDSVGLVAIETEYKESQRRDRYGNLFSLRANSVWRNDEGKRVNRPVFDVYLTVRGAPKPASGVRHGGGSVTPVSRQ
jgi:hypothetical protein